MRKIFLLILTIFIFSGCTTKVIETVYVEKKLPILKQYQSINNYQFGKLKNKNGKVCILKWNVCIKKEEFLDLVYYIKDIKSTNEKYNNQIRLYNELVIKENKKEIK